MLMTKIFKESMMSEQQEKKAEDYGSRMAVGIVVLYPMQNEKRSFG